MEAPKLTYSTCTTGMLMSNRNPHIYRQTLISYAYSCIPYSCNQSQYKGPVYLVRK